MVNYKIISSVNSPVCKPLSSFFSPTLVIGLNLLSFEERVAGIIGKKESISALERIKIKDVETFKGALQQSDYFKNVDLTKCNEENEIRLYFKVWIGIENTNDDQSLSSLYDKIISKMNS